MVFVVGIAFIIVFIVLTVVWNQERKKDSWLGPGTKHVRKGWGHEIWIWNGNYCGKVLHFEKGKRLSFHWHILKEETFFLHNGEILLKYGWDNDINKAEEILLKPGDTFYIPPGLKHQMIANEESDLFEVSTHHYDADSIRIIKGD